MFIRYLGIKKVMAFEREGRLEDRRGIYPVGSPGYEVTYPGGYKSWCPKGEFEKYNIKFDGFTLVFVFKLFKAVFSILRR